MHSSTLYVLRCEVAQGIFNRCLEGLSVLDQELKRITGVEDFTIIPKPAPEWIREAIGDLLKDPDMDIDDISAALEGQLDSRGEGAAKVLVVCRKTHPLALRAMEQLPHAVWGIAIQGGALSAVYGNFKNYPVWHEVLHLYGADDCYDSAQCRDDPSGQKTTCGTVGCIMGYGVRIPREDAALTLCRANANAVREHIGA